MNRINEVEKFRKRDAKGEPVYLDTPKGVRRIGKRFGEFAFFPVEFGRHFFRKRQGWTLDNGVLETLEAKGVREIIFDDRENKKAWVCTLQDFIGRGELTHNDSGLKRVLHRDFWSRADEDPILEADYIPAPDQPELFAGMQTGGHYAR